jgi:hypothetical protein
MQMCEDNCYELERKIGRVCQMMEWYQDRLADCQLIVK